MAVIGLSGLLGLLHLKEEDSGKAWQCRNYWGIRVDPFFILW